MKRKLLIELEYDPSLWFNEDKEEEQEWFEQQILKGCLSLYSKDAMDDIGPVKVCDAKEILADLQYWIYISECQCDAKHPIGSCLRCDLEKIKSFFEEK
jgi:hypothetical protein